MFKNMVGEWGQGVNLIKIGEGEKRLDISI
jgi:hypothetical protein